MIVIGIVLINVSILIICGIIKKNPFKMEKDYPVYTGIQKTLLERVLLKFPTWMWVLAAVLGFPIVTAPILIAHCYKIFKGKSEFKSVF